MQKTELKVLGKRFCQSNFSFCIVFLFTESNVIIISDSVQMPLANRCQKHNAQAYHHLVCEQHLFLRTMCLADSSGKEDRKLKKLRKMLCESAANLAELFARLVQPVFVLKCIRAGILKALNVKSI